MANFSGGYGYMPYVVLLSGPAGFLSMLISSSIIYRTAQKMLGADEELSENTPRADISDFMSYAWRHIGLCLVFYTLASAGFIALGISAEYEAAFQWHVMAFFCGAGPFILSLLSTLWLVDLIRTEGVQKKHLNTVILFFIIPPILIIICFYLVSVLSSILTVFN